MSKVNIFSTKGLRKGRENIDTCRDIVNLMREENAEILASLSNSSLVHESFM